MDKSKNVMHGVLELTAKTIITLLVGMIAIGVCLTAPLRKNSDVTVIN